LTDDNTDGDPAPSYRKKRARNIFAVDRWAWARVCGLGLNAAVAYLVLARGSGGDQRTVGWSVHAIETRTGISRPNAKKAVEVLKQNGFIRQLKGGTKPQYYIVPAHEVQRSASNSADLTPEEARVLAAIRAGHRRPPRTNGGKLWGDGDCLATAKRLDQAGWIRGVGHQEYEAVDTSIDQAEPDWIWLTNAIVDGAGGETPPVELIRQTQNASALRLFIDLYKAQDLRAIGGVNWRPASGGLRDKYIRTCFAERGQYLIWGFERENRQADWQIVNPYLTGQKDAAGYDMGWDVFWTAFGVLTSLGLVEMVPHLVESYSAEGESILSLGSTHKGEQEVSIAVSLAADTMLVDWQQKRLEMESFAHLVPLPKHIANVEMVGVARLRYLPHTELTTAWLKTQSEQWAEWTSRYLEIEAKFRGLSTGMQYQG
jgi:hypothetical protein